MVALARSKTGAKLPTLKAPTNGMPKPDFQISIIFLEAREGLVSLPRVSMIASMEKYA